MKKNAIGSIKSQVRNELADQILTRIGFEGGEENRKKLHNFLKVHYYEGDDDGVPKWEETLKQINKLIPLGKNFSDWQEFSEWLHRNS